MEWLIVPYMALLSRMCGGGKPRLPLGLDQWLYAIPYGLVAYLLLQSSPASVMEQYPYFIWIAVTLAYLGAFLGKRTGHGGFMDLGTWTRARKRERLEFLIKPLENKLDVYWYDFLGLVLTGVSCGLLCACVIAYSNPVAAGLLIVSGGAKGIAYMIGWRFGKYPTEIGEVLTGLFAGLGVTICLIM